MSRVPSRAVPCLLALLAGVSSTARAQVALGSLDHPDSFLRDRFGGALASDGSTLVVGEHGGTNVQQVYVYSIEGSRPILQQVLSSLEVPASEPLGDRFGWSCSIDGDTLIVGCPSAFVNGSESAGAAFVYRRIDGTWTWTQTLVDAVPQRYSYFAFSVCLRGDRVVVGSPYEGKTNVGSASLFEFRGGSWQPMQELSGYGSLSEFGASVAIDGDWLLVGAPNQYNAFLVKSHAYFFRYDASPSGGHWTKVHDFPATGPGGQALGQVVALRGGWALASDPGHFDNGGIEFNRVFAYELGASGTWSETQTLFQPEIDEAGSNYPSFGNSLALGETDLLVGSPYFKEDGAASGRAYRFRRGAGGWQFHERLKPPVSERADASGSAVALVGSSAFLANPSWDGGCGPSSWFPHFPECSARGLVHRFLLSEDAQPYCPCPSPPTCANADGYGGCANSWGAGATLGAGGSGSVGADDLRLQAAALPGSQVAVLLAGPDAASGPFGDGKLCVAGPLLRYPLASSGARGVLDFGPGLVQEAALLAGSTVFHPGETWHFQVVYRDPLSPCGSGVNLTNAVRVDFKP